jgi:hypothetical protein
MWHQLMSEGPRRRNIKVVQIWQPIHDLPTLFTHTRKAADKKLK